MCDEREQLIEYIYGESDAKQRQKVEAHLTDCHVCRTEVAGLRSVRDDLLAWEVPRHEAIWRPVTPAPVIPLWRRMPTWGLAAAASVLFAAGLAGGIGARTVMQGPASNVPVMASAPGQGTVTISADELSRIEARLEASILQRVRGEMETRMQAVASAPSSQIVHTSTTPGEADRISARLAIIEQWKDDQIALNVYNVNQFGRLARSTRELNDRVDARVQQVGFEPGSR